jgi:hypothetical protein
MSRTRIEEEELVRIGISPAGKRCLRSKAKRESKLVRGRGRTGRQRRRAGGKGLTSSGRWRSYSSAFSFSCCIFRFRTIELFDADAELLTGRLFIAPQLELSVPLAEPETDAAWERARVGRRKGGAMSRPCSWRKSSTTLTRKSVTAFQSCSADDRKKVNEWGISSKLGTVSRRT